MQLAQLTRPFKISCRYIFSRGSEDESTNADLIDRIYLQDGRRCAVRVMGDQREMDAAEKATRTEELSCLNWKVTQMFQIICRLRNIHAYFSALEETGKSN